MNTKEKILNWADAKNITHPDNLKTQMLKTVEEVGELAQGILKDKNDLIIDAIGDVMVTLIILADIKGLDIDRCLDHAWNEIKDRTGKTINGTFIKD